MNRRRQRIFEWVLSAALVCLMLSCIRSTSPSPHEAGEATHMKFNFDRADDPRTYSIGTIVMRAFDLEGNLLVASTPFSSEEFRATGHFEFDFAVPAGNDRVIVAEPRGSGLPAGGGKTESGVAFQGRDTLDIPAGGRADSIIFNLKPFIPDSLEVIVNIELEEDTLTWKKMEIATSHVIRYQEWSDALAEFVPFEIEQGAENMLRLDEIRSAPGAALTRFQVASVNDISQSAFSDTLFYQSAPAPSANHPISGTVVDANTGGPVAGATVTAEGPVTRNATTNENGAYVIPDLPDGSYTITVEQDGFVVDEIRVEIDGAAVSLDVSLSPDGHPLTGTVVDATSGEPVAGAMVTVDGPVTQSDTTDENGEYEFPNLPDGTYTTTVELDGFVVDETIVEINGGPVERDVILSPSIGVDQFRIVLSWGALPSDLDSHLFISNGAHVFFDSVGSDTTSPFANLDVDDTSSFGPETITIHQLIASYQYSVFNFSQFENPQSTPLTGSGAFVRVYSGDMLIRSYTVPSTGEGLWWHVFELDENGTITDRNVIDNSFPKSDEPTKPDYRKITN